MDYSDSPIVIGKDFHTASQKESLGLLEVVAKRIVAGEITSIVVISEEVDGTFRFGNSSLHNHWGMIGYMKHLATRFAQSVTG